MTDKELKWYVVSHVGSKISKSKIIRNKGFYKKLQSELNARDIDDILEQLHNLGFTLIAKTDNSVKEEPVKIYKIEPQSYEKPSEKGTLEHNKYISSCISNNKERMASYYQQKRKEKIKYGLSKPYYRENTNYSSIW